MTEDQIERRVEKMVDRLDAQFMADNSPMTQAEYEAEMGRINAWAKAKYEECE